MCVRVCVDRADENLMRRRTFISLVGAAAATPPWPAGAQQTGRPPRIGYLGSNEKDSEVVRAFLRGLNERGFREGQNLDLTLIDYATASGTLAAKASALVDAKPELIVADGPEAVLRAVRDHPRC